MQAASGLLVLMDFLTLGLFSNNHLQATILTPESIAVEIAAAFGNYGRMGQSLRPLCLNSPSGQTTVEAARLMLHFCTLSSPSSGAETRH